MSDDDRDKERRCRWCREALGDTFGQRFCSKRCRQTAWRLRKRGVVDQASATPALFAYADPPYPGLSWKYYRRPEVDHAALIAGLEARRQAHAARGGGELPGRKPIAFCAWLFRLLGMAPGDQLEDLFPGTGVISRAWAELSLTAAGDARRASTSDGVELPTETP